MGGACRIKRPRAWEKELLIVLVERHGKYTVSGPESLFDAITVVDIDVNVEDAGVVAEQLKNCEYDVVDVAEATCFCLFSVMQAAGPVYSDIGLIGGKLASSVDRCAGVEGTVIKKAVKDGAVVTHAE
jgi:hypothetical protein